VEGVLNVWVGPADDPAAARPVTHDTCRPIRFCGWAYTDQRVLYIHDKHGDENWQLYSVDLKAGALKRLTPMEGVQARIQHTSHKFPDEVLVAPNDRDPRLHDAYRVNISTGEMRLVQQNPGFVGILTDDDYDIRLATRVTPDGGSEIPQPIADGGWEVYIKIEMEDVLTTNPCTTPPSRSSMPTGIGPTGIRRRSGE
jgi:Tol biopolymer transport system component